MTMRWGLALIALLAAASPSSAEERKPPYWASIASGEAMLRAGPGRNYPGVWLYKRRDLPVRVVQTYPNWRKIEDPDGEQGWMLIALLSSRRTGMIRPGGTRDVLARPEAGAPVRYRAEAGVVGRIDRCDGRWCHIAFGRREGWIAQSELIGVDPGESFKE